jgi:glycine/D-amino acid oxidase-like deaminating enzyme/nitrite reductase/ring-hydroxylating ferredoxin subunit
MPAPSHIADYGSGAGTQGTTTTMTNSGMTNSGMTNSGPKQVSLWLDTFPVPSLKDPVLHPVEVDVAVLGAGIVGLSTALLCKREGLRVAVIEAKHVAYGATGHSTVKAAVGHGTRLSSIEKTLGSNAAQAYAAANLAGRERIVQLAEELSIPCDMSRGPHYVYADAEQDVERLRAEAELAARLELPATFVDQVPLPVPAVAAVRFDNEVQLHPAAYLAGLATAIDGDGSHIFQHARAVGVDDGEPCAVHTEAGDVRADRVVVATHYPTLDRGGLFAKLGVKREYAVAGVLPAGTPGGMTISIGSRTRSTRTFRLGNEDLLIIVGETHETGTDDAREDRYAALEEWGRRYFGITGYRYRWSTQDPVSLDGVPYAGRLPGAAHVFAATGFGGWGMSNGTASAMILTDLLMERTNPWASVFSPARLGSVGTVPRLAKLQAKVATRWLKDRVTGTEPGTPAELGPGEAGVFMVNGNRTAASRDEDGTLHAVSAVCTHLKCIVHWNAAERSWDCPCHGSRFTPRGEVLNAPATAPLAPVELPDSPR